MEYVGKQDFNNRSHLTQNVFLDFFYIFVRKSFFCKKVSLKFWYKYYFVFM